jgi:hypothetical protein
MKEKELMKNESEALQIVFLGLATACFATLAMCCASIIAS